MTQSEARHTQLQGCRDILAAFVGAHGIYRVLYGFVAQGLASEFWQINQPTEIWL